MKVVRCNPDPLASDTAGDDAPYRPAVVSDPRPSQPQAAPPAPRAAAPVAASPAATSTTPAAPSTVVGGVFAMFKAKVARVFRQHDVTPDLDATLALLDRTSAPTILAATLAILATEEAPESWSNEKKTDACSALAEWIASTNKETL